MGEWKVEGRYFDYGKEWWIVDENGHSVLGPIKFPHDFPKPEIVDQIVREHNAHEGLVRLMKDYRSLMVSRFGDEAAYVSIIDAALALAEGRE